MITKDLKIGEELFWCIRATDSGRGKCRHHFDVVDGNISRTEILNHPNHLISVDDDNTTYRMIV